MRLIGVNTPERGQCFYEEATDFTTAELQGASVRLEYDEDRIDRFDRTLAYVRKPASCSTSAYSDGGCKGVHSPAEREVRRSFRGS
ncbi:MAG TPA: thermonuclease family protein [Actinomycetota bacterium]|nr:thermonuclease family protein [Actinomycetota bacterium]